MDLFTLLKQNSQVFHPLFKPELSRENTFFLDLSINNPQLAAVDLTHTPSLDDYLGGLISTAGKQYGYGGYMEDREVYRRSSLFSGSQQEARSIHLGIDVWTRGGHEVILPLDGTVHSFQNNDRFGDYGPTIIMEHRLQQTTFYTLYGHLSLDSLTGLEKGLGIKAGQVLCRVGDPPVNGDWPPHLHFQIIGDLLGNSGDFPGVCFSAEKEYYSKICPDPVVFFPGLEQGAK